MIRIILILIIFSGCETEDILYEEKLSVRNENEELKILEKEFVFREGCLNNNSRFFSLKKVWPLVQSERALLLELQLFLGLAGKGLIRVLYAEANRIGDTDLYLASTNERTFFFESKVEWESTENEIILSSYEGSFVISSESFQKSKYRNSYRGVNNGLFEGVPDISPYSSLVYKGERVLWEGSVEVSDVAPFKYCD